VTQIRAKMEGDTAKKNKDFIEEPEIKILKKKKEYRYFAK